MRPRSVEVRRKNHLLALEWDFKKEEADRRESERKWSVRLKFEWHWYTHNWTEVKKKKGKRKYKTKRTKAPF